MENEKTKILFQLRCSRYPNKSDRENKNKLQGEILTPKLHWNADSDQLSREQKKERRELGFSTQDPGNEKDGMRCSDDL